MSLAARMPCSGYISRHKCSALQVLGGTVNCGSGSLIIETTALAGNSAVARMAQLVEEVRHFLPKW